MKRSRFGQAFPDQLKKVSLKYKHFKHNTKDQSDWQDSLILKNAPFTGSKLVSPWRKLSYLVVCLILFSGLSVRLFHLQVVEGKKNLELANSNRIKVKVVHAPRGVIFDRNGKILAQNEPGFRLVEQTPAGPRVTFLTRDEALNLEIKSKNKLNDLEIDNIRSYPYSEKTSHIIGYVGEITSEELKDPMFKTYKLGDKIGRNGVEQNYEKVLKGVDGGEIIEVDAVGNKVRILSKTQEIPGQNLFLTIDADLQKVTYEKLEEGTKKSGSCCGAAIAQDPKSGQILALVSYPAFSPDDISGALSQPFSPMLNRVISGIYPPGSTFKIVSSLAGLSSGKITAQTQFEDHGFIELGPYKFSNWYFTQYGKTEGSVDLVKALKRSNDTYFYLLGESVGEKILADEARRLGFGKKVGIDIIGESIGIVPNGAWKKQNIGEVWFPGDTLHMAIGQGFVLTTPLQISNLISTIASDGMQYLPHLALKITDNFGNSLKQFKYDPQLIQDTKPEHIKLVKEGLAQVPKDGGTAWPFFAFPISTAGKTGTAEFGDPNNDNGSIGRYRTHAWYTSYGPVDNPSIALTVLVEAGGEGSTVAGSISKEIYRWYFSTDKSKLIKDLIPVASDSARTLGE